MDTWTLTILLTLIPAVAGDIVNVALNKPASMSSYYGQGSLTAGGAVDGNTTSRWPNIINTVENQPFAWWKVDLEREVQDATVRIYFRTDYKYRRNGVKLYTSLAAFSKPDPPSQAKLCYTVTRSHHGANIPDIVNTTCPGRWRYLMVYTDIDNDQKGAVLDFGEVEVGACDPRTYGVNCFKNCSSRHCSSLPTFYCNAQNGQCPDGCEPGWTGVDCTRECSPGISYGVNCEKYCRSRHCMTSSRECDPQTGQCHDGCSLGWRGKDCTQACVNGTYGFNCSKICGNRHCLLSLTDCNHETGQCANGCGSGWTGVDCTSPCVYGTYGVNCSKICSSRHCSSTTSNCNNQTGQCPDGCKPGWTGVDCTSQCPSETFGSNCTSCTTRHCQGESDCPADGTCSHGCQDGWTGNSCISECAMGENEPDCSNDCSKCKTGCEPLPEQCPIECGVTRDRSECEMSGQSEHPLGSHVLVIACAAVGGVVVVMAIIVAVIYKRRKRRLPRMRRPHQDVEAVAAANGRLWDQLLDAARKQPTCSSVLNAANVPVHAKREAEVVDAQAADVDVDNHCVYYNVEELGITGEIDVADLQSTVFRIAEKKRFNTLFESLPEGFLAPYEDSRLAVNAGKNKYKEYYPYDHNRVRLSLLPDVPGSDYINASIMHVYGNEKTYIAAQAPNKKTVDDFWRMIWEQRCRRVVMLTGLVEGNIVKSYKYWSDDVFMDTENFHIELTSTQQRANHTVRYFQLSSYKTGESRRVVQYHYTTWPDHGVPDTLALVNFIWMMRRTHTRTDGPLLVHCSAGVGRTGTYIAVDSLLDQARGEGKVDVQGFVSIMRRQRKNMIQTVDQYECVFNCLVEMTKYGNTSLTVDDFSTLYTNSGMDARVDSAGKTFRELAQMQLAEKRNDSPNQNRLRVDGNQEFLVTALPSLRSVRGHLLCESPHPGQEKLLWKLVEENNVNNVIVVSQEQQIVDLTQGCRIKLGEVTLTCLETRRMESELFFSQLILKNNRTEDAIKLFRFSGSASIGGVTARVLDHAPLRAVAEDVDPVVIVHSQTDQQVAVSLSILLNLLAGVMTDHRVDITGNIRTILKCCPQLNLFEHEMEELHNIALRCVRTLEADRMYANL